MNHIEALELCLDNPDISDEIKVHLSDIRTFLLNKKVARKLSPKEEENKKIRTALDKVIMWDILYTAKEIVKKAEECGYPMSERRAISFGNTIGMRRVGVVVSKSTGEQEIVYCRKSKKR